ncbi:MAG TPA: multiheme c-type cytochrome [Nitrospira sp.]|nr:multiheme c-type cytochrome [Nitrospira sp.]
MDGQETASLPRRIRTAVRRYGLSLAIVVGVLTIGLVALHDHRHVLAQSVSAGGSQEGEACIGCHSTHNAALVEDWRLGAHGQRGINCADCHRAEKSDPDAMEHYGHLVATLVTPKDCARCHQKEVNQQKGSHHASAGQILASTDNYLGEVVTGPAAAATGCWQCHGSAIKVLPGGKLDPATWPNTGIGRINPDGSWGSCSACHTRHTFSKAQAREPQTCGKCHLGPDHPQMEVYQESKHGILYEANKSRLNLDRNKWIVGVDYSAAPTCATCHMSATPGQAVTHDVGDRISWTLRPAVSVKLNMVIFEDLTKTDIPEGKPVPKVGDLVKAPDGTSRKVKEVLSWQDRRNGMKDVCRQCHADPFVTGFYRQFDDLVDLYNEKFAKPATALVQELTKEGKISPAPFDDKLDWIYWELWHHQGRRARHGASMSGPDYAFWHGMYDVAQTFYQQFLPEVKAVAGEPLASQLLEKHVYAHPAHKWLKEGMTKDQLKNIQEYYRQRYGEAAK